MKSTKAFTAVEVIIVMVVVALLVLMAIPALEHVRRFRAREERAERQVEAQETECAHKWGRWTQPVTSSDWFNGTRQYQSRTCEKCGLAETRRTQIAAGTQ